jgi:hypothetical protein
VSVSLYDLSVASYVQILGGLSGALEKSLGHFQAAGVDPDSIVSERLFEDMLPFAFQIHSVAHHSVGALEAVKNGVFTPPPETPKLNYAGFQKLAADAKAKLEALDPAEVNSLAGRDVSFKFRDFTLPFTTEGFLLSFSLPNFYFHATTAYDILRSRGAPLGKRDFMGGLRLKS